MSQAVKMSWATPQRTFERRSAEPTPMIAELTTWLVLSGPPSSEAVSTTEAAVNWAVKPCTGRMRYILPPTVRITRQPPVATPAASAPALMTTTQKGTLKRGSRLLATRTRTMIAMVFCASLVPKLMLSTTTVSSWARLKKALMPGGAFRARARMSRISKKPAVMLTNGPSVRARAILTNPTQRRSCRPLAEATAPASPPISACDELAGRPNHQASRFQTSAAPMAASTTLGVRSSAFTKSRPMVTAMAVPNANGPTKAAMAASIRAARADIARDEMTVATMEALSFTPFT